MLRREFWDTDGTINTIVATNGVVYVGGRFDSVAPKGRKVSAFDFYTAAPDSEFPRIFGASIDVIIEDGAGGWYIGGEFNEVGGVPRANLVRVLSNRQVDPAFQPNPDKRVRSLLLEGGVLYVGGAFASIGGESRNLIAALDPVSGTPLSYWNPNATRNGASEKRVSALATDGEIVYAGGLFDAIGGATRRNIAALRVSDGTAIDGWDPMVFGEVRSLGLIEYELFLGGSFNSIDGNVRSGLASIETRTGALTSWDPNAAGGNVNVVKVDCNTVYVGGSFTNLGNQPRVRVGAVDINTGNATDWNPGVGLLTSAGSASSVLDLELFGNTVYLAGEFSTVNGFEQRDIAAVELESGALLYWDPHTSGGVTAVAAAGRTVLAGSLSSPGGVDRLNLAAFDEITGQPTEWNPGANGEVLALAAAGTNIYAGGRFTEVAGLSRLHLAAIALQTGEVVAGWDPAANTNVYALATDESRLYAAGQFTSIDGISRLRLAALDLDDGQVIEGWAPSVSDNTVRRLALDGDTLYLAGTFSIVEATFRSRLAAVDTGSGALLDWNPDASSSVFALAVDGGTVYVGGDFSSVGGALRSRIAALDNNLGMALSSWDPGADGRVNDIVVSGSSVYAGGSFTSFGETTRWGVASIDTGGTLLEWNPGSVAGFNDIRTLTLSGRALYVAGIHQLRFASSPSVHSLAAFPPVGSPAFVEPPANVSIPPGSGQNATFDASAEGLAPLSYQWSLNGILLPDETNALLVVNDVDPTNAGIYQVVVTNALGAIAAEAVLTVLEPVMITMQPSVASPVAPGSTVVLSVGATGNPPPLYQWRLNGANIPGAVFPTLTLTNVQPADGGNYHVVVVNSSTNAESSAVAELVVTSDAHSFSDSFDGRVLNPISGLSGTIGGSNDGMTNETGEPRHAGKPGGASVWVMWEAPDTGIATFSTRGSSFDTLLGIYSGTNLATLAQTEEASDEDRGGFFTSLASFNATAGTKYSVAIDGLAGASGNIVLKWDLDTSTVVFPRITADPQSRSVTNGGTVMLSVGASSPSSLTYQWFFGCRDLPGETNSTLVISNVQRRHVGSYRVVVMNDSARAAESLPAALEIGPEPLLVSIDKLADALAVVGAGGGQERAGDGSGGGGGSADAWVVGFGSTVTQTFDTSDKPGSPGPANYCGVSGGAMAFLPFIPEQDGVVVVDTIGSSFDTVLTVLDGINQVDCDNDGAPDGIRSLVRFNAIGNAYYTAVVDGVNGAKGDARINWRLGLVPVPDPAGSNPVSYVARVGSSVMLQAFPLLLADPDPVYQWMLNGAVIHGATGSTLELTNLQPEHHGAYSVVASNFAGSVTMEIGTVAVEVPILTSRATWTGQEWQFQLEGEAGVGYLLQESGDLIHWSNLLTNVPGGPPVQLIIPQIKNEPSRFYRTQPWP